MNIALISSYLLQIGGVESHLLALMRHSQQSEYSWQVMAPMAEEFTRPAKAAGAKLIQWQPQSFSDFKSIRGLKTLLRQQQIDVAHFHCPRSAFLGRIAAHRAGIATVVTTHLPLYHYPDGMVTRSPLRLKSYLRAERWLNRRYTDYLIYVSSYVYDEAASMGLLDHVRAEVIRNGIDADQFTSDTENHSQRAGLRGDYGASNGVPIILTVCRLDNQKGVDVLLQATKLLRERQPYFRLWIVGDGPLRSQLEMQARECDLESHVKFFGFRQDVPQMMLASDLFVLASRYEAMPIAILEALAAGLPCVVSNVGENSRVVHHGQTGLIVPSENPVALASALEELLGNQEIREQMRANALKQSISFSETEMVRQTLNVYESVRKIQQD